MHTLKQAGDFVGIPRGALQVARFGGPDQITLNNVSILISPKKYPDRPRSLKAIMQILDNLPPLRLDATTIAQERYTNLLIIKFRLSPSDSIVWNTVVSDSNDAHALSMDNDAHSRNFNEGGEFEIQLGPGSYNLIVERTGIGAAGMTVLHADLGKFHQDFTPPTPTPTPTPTPLPPVAPSISVKSKGDGSFLVSGSGFLGKAQVYISIGVKNVFANPAILVVTSEAQGTFTDFPTGPICDSPGRQLVFTGSDGRIVNGHQLFSDPVTISCPA